MNKYIYCLKRIKKNELFEGLLGYGLFNSKMPPFLTSEPFYKHCSSIGVSPKKTSHDWIRFENNRNNGLARFLGVPQPFAYYYLCKDITKYWDNLLLYFEDETKDQQFKISRIHIRKLKKSKRIFEMNYDKYSVDGPNEPSNIVKARFVVKADISQCFASIYTHSIPWAIIGKANSKKGLNNYSNELDLSTRNTTYSETHGLLIGPVSSNLLSEIILCKVDSILSKQGFIFVRNIDDYKCYVESIQKGESFLSALRIALANYDLAINDKKTEICSLYSYRSKDLAIRIHQLDHLIKYQDGLHVITYPQITNYFDAITQVYIDLDCNASVFSFAFKILRELDLSVNASKFLVDKAMNLAIIHPYLLPFVQSQVFERYGVTNNIDEFCKTLYFEGIKEINYEKCIYGLFFAMINGIDISADCGDTIKNNALDFEDCFLRLTSWLYCECF